MKFIIRVNNIAIYPNHSTSRDLNTNFVAYIECSLVQTSFILFGPVQTSSLRHERGNKVSFEVYTCDLRKKGKLLVDCFAFVRKEGHFATVKKTTCDEVKTYKKSKHTRISSEIDWNR